MKDLTSDAKNSLITTRLENENLSLFLQPATVSRCGMIYLEPSQLGWKPLVSSWLNSLKGPLQEPDHQALLRGLFDWLIEPTLNLRKKKCKVTL